MEDKLKAFLMDIQSQLGKAVEMCEGSQDGETEGEPEMSEYASDDSMPDEKALRKERLKLKMKKEFGA